MNMTNDTMNMQASLFRALMHPSRIAILEALRFNEECVCHLEAHLEMRQAYLSQQLAVLRKAGLIVDRREGLNIFYRISRPEVLSMLDLAHGMVGGRRPVAPTAVACPCPKCAPVIA